jgi:hypothetical protein
MGGLGSGNCGPRWNRKKTVQEFQHRCLNVTDLAHAGILKDGGVGTVTWSSGRRGPVTAEADVEVFEDSDGEVRLGLTYRQPAEMTPGQEEITLAYDFPPFGGRRWWFLCPGCGRRRMQLYLRNRALACRVCHRLTYRSCQETHRLKREFAA